MSSARLSYLPFPTPISTFIEFLRGKEVPDYNDSGERILNVLSTVLYIGLRKQFATFLLKQKERLPRLDENNSIGDLDVIDFLTGVFPSVFDVGAPGPIGEAFTQISRTSGEILFNWLNGYQS